MQEKIPHVLEFEQPGTPGAYEEIRWYKGSTHRDDRIVFYIGGTVNYYNDYCLNDIHCETSEKGELNTDTGDFTIHSVELIDDGYYYYRFYVDNDNPDTGSKYEYNMEVYGNYITFNTKHFHYRNLIPHNFTSSLHFILNVYLWQKVDTMFAASVVFYFTLL